MTTFTSDRIYADDPEENTDYPFLVYELSGSQPVMYLGGTTNISTYEVTINFETKSLATRTGLGDAVKAQLHAYRGGMIQLGKLLTYDTQQISDEQEGDIYSGTQTYSVIVVTGQTTSPPPPPPPPPSGSGSPMGMLLALTQA